MDHENTLGRPVGGGLSTACYDQANNG
jgi:hypothetical protein